MIKAMMSMFCVASLVACGGGGGRADEETGYAFLEAVPSDEVLCSFVVGETTQAEVLDVLGEPTNYSGDTRGSFLQYWIGSLGEIERSGVRGVYFSFGVDGTLESPSVTQIPFPQCWRDQLAARDAAAGRDVEL